MTAITRRPERKAQRLAMLSQNGNAIADYPWRQIPSLCSEVGTNKVGKRNVVRKGSIRPELEMSVLSARPV